MLLVPSHISSLPQIKMAASVLIILFYVILSVVLIQTTITPSVILLALCSARL